MARKKNQHETPQVAVTKYRIENFRDPRYDMPRKKQLGERVTMARNLPEPRRSN